MKYIPIVLSAFLLGQALQSPPSPVTTPNVFWEVDWFSVPTGPLPWELPSFPPVIINVTPPGSEMDSIDHGAGYAAQVAEMEARYTAIQTPIQDANTLADSWVGGVELPDMTDGDFDTGLDPLGTGSMTASDFSTRLATNIATVYQYVRLLTSFDLGGTAYAVGFIMLCMAWMLFIIFVKFAIQITDMVYSVGVSLIELIPFVE